MRHTTLLALSTVSISALLVAAAPANAQNAPGQPAAVQPVTPVAAPTADDAETIVVTGSRIANPSAVSPSPLQVVDAKQIRDSGAVNIQDVLLQNPVFGTPGISRTNSSFATQSAGVATVDLHNLGSDRTLTLVNGRRFVAGVPGSSAVDLNVIPTQFLERVDVLTGGASAVYGSDAVAGVVNFIYKSHFDGIQADAQAGISKYGDGSDRQVNLLVGKNFADNRGNVMLFGGYSKQGTVLKRDRSTEQGSSAIDSTDKGLRNGNAADLFVRRAPFYSGFNPRGRYYVPNPLYVPPAEGEETDIPSTITFTYDPTTNALRPCVSTNGGICNLDGTPFEGSPLNGTRIGPDGFNRSAFRYLAVPVERYVAAGRANFEVSPAVNFFAEGNYARTQVSTIIEPFPLDSSNINPGTGGQIAVESLVNGVLYRNPYIPDTLFDLATDTDGDGLKDIFFDRRLADLGGRTSNAKRDLYRVAGGVNGKFGNHEQFNYEVYGVYGQTKERQTGNGQFNGPNFIQALNAIRDVNDINGNGNTTEIICADAAARAAGCIPANPFGAGSLIPAAAYIAAPVTLKTKVTQTVAGANVNGSLFSLFGADPIGFSLGGEYRKETSSNVFDVLTQQGLNGNNALPSTSGKFHVWEAFAEAIVPLFHDRPFFYDLSVRGAVRRSHYSTVGNTTSYNFGGEWAPVRDIRFRAMNARSVRAPNVNELFSPLLQDFPSGLTDPCDGVTATSSGTVATNCRAAAGVNANIAANGAFTVTQADAQGITSFAGGNLNLKAERGDSFTAGVVITPKSIAPLRNLTVTADYFNIRVKGAIVALPLQFILDQCYGQSNATYCAFIKRRPASLGANSSGSLDEVNSGSGNAGVLKTSGIDTTIAGRWNLAGGSFNAKVAYTHLLSGYLVPLPGEPRDYFANEIGAAKDRFTATTGWDGKVFGINFTGTYIGASYIDDQLAKSFTDDNDNPIPRHSKLFRVHPEFYLDGQMRFTVAPKFEFYLGANNLLDNKPPFISQDIGGSTGQDTDAGTYDALGRRYYAGVRVKF